MPRRDDLGGAAVEGDVPPVAALRAVPARARGARRGLDAVVLERAEQSIAPFFGALVNFADTCEYSWHTPGHTGGTAFMKTAVGRSFLDFYGEQMLRSDLSVEDLTDDAATAATAATAADERGSDG